MKIGMRKKLVAAGAGLGSAGAVFAMAATLGGITTNDLGADTSVVASCDSDGVVVDYTTAFDAANEIQEVTHVVVSGIDAACDTQLIDVGLTNAAGTSSVNAVQGTLDNTGSITLTITNGFPAEDVDHVAIVIQSA